jgi:pre-mRNA-splicing factor CWC22
MHCLYTFCLLNHTVCTTTTAAFAQNYATIHRLETNKLRNVAKLFSHLLYTDALPWTVLEEIRVNDTDTTSSSRIFIKILCQELSENMGLVKLRERFQDPYMAPIFRCVLFTSTVLLVMVS